MNQAAADALIEAAMKGTRQIREQMHDRYTGGLCAFGVLHVAQHRGSFSEAIECADRHASTRFVDWSCGWVQAFGLATEEDRHALCSANDAGHDFLDLARKLGPSGVVA